jgi:hypothetical protein
MLRERKPLGGFDGLNLIRGKRHDMTIKKVMTIETWKEKGMILGPFSEIFGLIPSQISNNPSESVKKLLDEALRNSEKEPVHAIDKNGERYESFFLFRGYVYEYSVGRAQVRYNDDQIKLLILEHFDKEQKKFERLNNIYTESNIKENHPQRERIPEHVRAEVWRRDGGKCVRCGSRYKLEYDHIVPLSKGGSNTVRNIELLCESCNRAKGNRIE